MCDADVITTVLTYASASDAETLQSVLAPGRAAPLLAAPRHTGGTRASAADHPSCTFAVRFRRGSKLARPVGRNSGVAPNAEAASLHKGAVAAARPDCKANVATLCCVRSQDADPIDCSIARSAADSQASALGSIVGQGVFSVGVHCRRGSVDAADLRAAAVGSVVGLGASPMGIALTRDPDGAAHYQAAIAADFVSGVLWRVAKQRRRAIDSTRKVSPEDIVRGSAPTAARGLLDLACLLCTVAYAAHTFARIHTFDVFIAAADQE